MLRQRPLINPATGLPLLDDNGTPGRWIEMVRHTLRETGPKVLATRMVRDYVQQLYVPAARSARAMAESGYGAARTEAGWRARLLGWDDAPPGR